MTDVVIVGAGHGGVTAAEAVRRTDPTARIVLLDADDAVPYQRPPLSKELLGTGLPGEPSSFTPLPLRAERFFEEHRIEFLPGSAAVALDRAAAIVTTSDGGSHHYDRLILANGARARTLGLPGEGADGVLALRTASDAAAVAGRLRSARRAVLIGAGFIGTELAHAMRSHGLAVTVLDLAPKPLSRIASAPIADFAARSLGLAGIEFRQVEGVEAIEVDGTGAARAVAIDRGEAIRADLVIVAVGVTANDGLAGEAGLDVAGGVLVDETLRTADRSIWAIGDCAVYPSVHARRTLRVESVQNAHDQARYVARWLATDPDAPRPPYEETPWFWSHLGQDRLEIAGIHAAGDEQLIRGDPASGSFSVVHWHEEWITAVESVNSKADHLAARAILPTAEHPTRDQITDPDFDLRAFARSGAHRLGRRQ